MSEQFSRTELVLGTKSLEKLNNSHVAVFGVGGVGGYVVEALVRSGVGQIDIIDNDKVCLSNLNRQIIALHSTIGMYKTDAMEQRIKDINPECIVNKHNCFFLPENQDEFDFTQYDYVVDAVDTVTAKVSLVMKCNEAGTPIISSMGAGNKMHPEMFEIADIYKTSVCPLAKVMRHEMKKRNIKKLKVVYSKEQPAVINSNSDASTSDGPRKKVAPGSLAYVPSTAGLIIASEVINDLIKDDSE